MKAIRYKDGTLLMQGSQAHKLATEGKQKELDAHMKEVDARFRAAQGDQKWKLVVDHGHVRFLHKELPLWVTYYSVGGERGPFWQAYQAQYATYRDQKPWCCANQRIGAECVGFPTMQAAIDAAENWAKTQVRH